MSNAKARSRCLRFCVKQTKTCFCFQFEEGDRYAHTRKCLSPSEFIFSGDIFEMGTFRYRFILFVINTCQLLNTRVVICTDRRRRKAASVIGTFAAHITSDTFREMIDQSQPSALSVWTATSQRSPVFFSRAILLASYV